MHHLVTVNGYRGGERVSYNSIGGSIVCIGLYGRRVQSLCAPTTAVVVVVVVERVITAACPECRVGSGWPVWLLIGRGSRSRTLVWSGT